MRIFQVNNFKDYKKCIEFAFNGGGENYMGDEEPVFQNIEDLIDIYRVDGLHDEDGNPLWDDIDEELPSSVIEIITNERVKMLQEVNLEFPFVVAIGGETGFDRIGAVVHQTFYETKLEDI
jgi:hypothetical protein